MKKSFLISCCFLIISCFGQNANTFVPKVNNIPSSPEAALLGRFGDIPVGYYTGTADISIPLYTVNEGELQIPIVLRYQSSGVKVADEATWVGLGWSLEPGGAIIHEIRGKEDSVDNFYWPNHLGGTIDEYETFRTHLGNVGSYTIQVGDCLKQPVCGAWNCTPVTDAASILNSLLSNNGQPDIYHYNLPGYSGRYYKNPETGAIVFIEKKENLSFLNGEIITPEGIAYKFNEREETHSTSDASGYTSRLTSIRNTNGKIINFFYQTENYTSFSNFSNVVLNPYEHYNADDTPSNYFIPSYGTKKRLSQIETSDSYINFIAESREDMVVNANNNVQRLKAIEIISKITGKKTKLFQFNYSYFNPNQDYHSKRLKLDSVKEIGYDNNEIVDTSKPVYSFSYNNIIELPAKESMAVDFFGYFNGQMSNDTSIPNLKYFEYEHDWRYMTAGYQTFNYAYVGANRFADNSKASAYMLNKITYPTGGYTEFEFEPHTFSNQYIPNISQIYDAENIKLCSKNNTYTTYSDYFKTFELARSTSLHFRNTFTHGFPIENGVISTSIIGNIYNNSSIVLSKNTNGIITTIKSWITSDKISLEDFIDTGVITWEEDIWIPYEAGVTYTMSVSFPTFTHNYPNPYAAQTYSQCRFYNDSQTGKTSEQGGFRIKSIKNFTSENILSSHKQINYFNGKLLNRFEPIERLQAAYNYTQPYGDPCTQLQAEAYRLRLSISSDDLGLNGGNPVGYSKVEEIELANSSNIGKKVFHYFNEMNTNYKGFPYDPELKNGLITKEEVKDKYDDTVYDKTYTYTSIGSDNFFGIKIRTHQFGDTDFGGLGLDVDPLSLGAIIYKFSYFLYPISAYWWVLSNTSTNEYYNSEILSTTENYTYNTSGKLKTVTTTLNPDNINSTTYYYPGELPDALPIESTMMQNKMTGIPIQTEHYKNNVLLNTEKNRYSNFNGKLLPAYIFTKKGSENSLPFQQRVNIDYDDFGNIQQYIVAYGRPVIFLWGYNKTLPIAKIENATTAEIQIALGNSSATLSSYDESNINLINNLRQSLSKAMITTYTYRPLVGVSSITDYKGNTVYYEYDNFGRLLQVKDHFGKIISENNYHYRAN
jgi:hypothetical protein